MVTKKFSFVDAIFIFIVGFICLMTFYPLLYTFSMSISSPENVLSKSIWLLPKGFSLEAYKIIFKVEKIWVSYGNTVYYTVVGTITNVILTMMVAYPLSRKNFCLRNIIMIFIAVTMWFSGGIIPLFIVVNKLGLYNTRMALILPYAVTAWNIIIARTYLSSSIPESLSESATIDGANDIRILFSIVIPLSKPIIAVEILFYAVSHWNDFFRALIFLSDKELQPIQLFLRQVLIEQSEDLSEQMNYSIERTMIVEQLKYATIMFVMLPIMAIYPFMQKYFVKGIMIGAIKE